MATQHLSDQGVLRARTRRKVLWRVLPFLMVCYFISYVDRSNISFAGPNGMNQSLGLTATTFGLASGIFFIGYILLEIPSNLALHRFGARKWIARILISWGLIASLTAFVQDPTQLYVLRFLLGVAEAGFTPGILLYLTYWFVQKDRAQAFALFLIGIPLSSVIGAPLATALIQWGHNVFFDLEGWRFMILMTGLPAVVLGIMCFFYLTDRPSQAKWLTDEERNLLIHDLAAEEGTYVHHKLRAVLLNRKVWLLGLGYLGLLFGMYSISFFLPTIIKGFEQTFGTTYSVFEIGMLTAIPYGFGAVFTILWSMHSRRTNEIAGHAAISAMLGATGVLVAVWASSPLVTLIGISIAAMGLCSGIPLYFGLPTKFLSGVGAAAGLALINMIGNAGGFGGPFIFGWLRDLTGTTSAGMYVIAGFFVLAAVVALRTKRWTTPVKAAEQPHSHTVG
ncbi:MFS transporter [Arthrobacter sp. VKM Ac-2550]|uniref:MFS transporter n=1 Tax=Crystallibacter permensis TaxID=1938888 RepID=UPI00222634B0|nr:MFS transporter [Arthrobacter sp. VKM Ac-2550]MCW2131224.1 Sugar phosphate permease [Arthrobacter sp. VKM Ac-2550]